MSFRNCNPIGEKIRIEDSQTVHFSSHSKPYNN